MASASRPRPADKAGYIPAEPEEVQAIRDLQPGDEMYFGGSAAALSIRMDRGRRVTAAD